MGLLPCTPEARASLLGQVGKTLFLTVNDTIPFFFVLSRSRSSLPHGRVNPLALGERLLTRHLHTIFSHCEHSTLRWLCVYRPFLLVCEFLEGKNDCSLGAGRCSWRVVGAKGMFVDGIFT